MSTLLLNSLEVQHYRSLRHVRIERLGRVNLFVGKNNVGKSSLLEALRLYARRGDPALIWELLEVRDELNRTPRVELDQDALGMVLNIRHLFEGRKDIRVQQESIRVGPMEAPELVVSIGIDWLAEQQDAQGQLPSELHLVQNVRPLLSVEVGEHIDTTYFLDSEIQSWKSGGRVLRSPHLSDVKASRSVFVPAQGLSDAEVVQLWDSISLTTEEQAVTDGLRVIDPDVERLNLVGESRNSTKRVPIVKLRGLDEPVTLRSLGEGMNRLFTLTLALVSARNGLFLIDEIESGLHYSVQSAVWRLVFAVAQRLNVQVFATSHSWDCIEAFQQAAQENEYEQGMLIRLERRADETVVTTFDERRLAIATRDLIEVR